MKESVLDRPRVALIQFRKTVVSHFGEDKSIVRSEFRERCFIYQSFGVRVAEFGDHEVEPNVSFLADSGRGVAAEWEPRYGPIQIWRKCDEDWSGTLMGSEIKARAHWHYDFVQDDHFAWSQMAVEREGLPPMLGSCDLDGIFDVLARWADRDD